MLNNNFDTQLRGDIKLSFKTRSRIDKMTSQSMHDIVPTRTDVPDHSVYREEGSWYDAIIPTYACAYSRVINK